MVTGASTSDVAIILVDARYGVQVQTKRHSFISDSLGIKQFVDIKDSWIAEKITGAKLVSPSGVFVDVDLRLDFCEGRVVGDVV